MLVTYNRIQHLTLAQLSEIGIITFGQVYFILTVRQAIINPNKSIDIYKNWPHNHVWHQTCVLPFYLREVDQ